MNRLAWMFLVAFAGRGPGDSVAEQWLWTNDFGSDLLANYAQIISTRSEVVRVLMFSFSFLSCYGRRPDTDSLPGRTSPFSSY